MNKPSFNVIAHGINMTVDPETYASFWGCDPCYDKPPMKLGDGEMFYQFGSEHKKDKQWHLNFAEAIDRLISKVQHSFHGNNEQDIKDLTTLKEWVIFLANET